MCFYYFQQHDIVSDKVPEKFDLILTRHTLIHLFYNDIFQALDQFVSSGSSYLLMTQESNQVNTQVPKEVMGSHRGRSLNFFKPPFNLPAPICIGKDTKENAMYVMLYDMQTLKTSLRDHNVLNI